MFKRFVLLLSLVALTLSGVQAQRVIRLGSGSLTLKDNVAALTEEATRGSQDGADNAARLMVLRFDKLPTAQQKAEMRKQGIELHAYISHNTYYATVKGAQNPQAMEEMTRGASNAAPVIRQAEKVDPLWKVSPEVSSGRIPEWARGEKAGKARIIVEFFKWAKTDEVANQLKSSGIRIVNMMEQFRMAEVEMPVANALQLAENDWVRWIGFVSRPVEPENWQGRSMSRVNVLSQAVTLGGYNLTGKGQDVGIWDGNIEKHDDLGNRLRSHEFVSTSTSAHGQHTSGTLAGGGVLDPRAKGMAPEAIVHAWNYTSTTASPNGNLSTPSEMALSARDFGVRITSNSYGVGLYQNQSLCTSPYTYQPDDRNEDLITNDLYPEMLHFFSAGNDQASCEAVGTGYPNPLYGTSTKRIKNAILVGALNEREEMTDFSSWGPTPDGRILPHVSAFGEEVYSTVHGNKYEGGYNWAGTSMACPAAAGTATLLYEYYQRLHGKKPLASLAKALIMNGARDLGNAGPDYQYGYGVVDGLRSVRMVENNYWFVDAVDHGEAKNFSINVPANTTELRVMLVWSDVPSATYSMGEIVNDLDLTVEGGGSINYPWVLTPADPEKPATRGVDHINNQEQVVISNPAAGTYTIKVNGYAIPEGPQQFAVVYDFYTKGVEVTFPNGNDVLVPGDVHVARWNTSGLTDKIRVELSTDGGKTFQVIGRDLPANATQCTFTVPNVATDKAVIKVQQGASVDLSDAQFIIMGVPQNVQATSVTPCAADSWQLVWDAVAGATQYAVLKVNPADGSTTEMGRTAATTYALPAISERNGMYSVAAVSADGIMGQRSYVAKADVSLPVVVTATKAFNENFETIPSDYVTLKAGQYVKVEFIQTPFDYSTSRVIKMQGTGENDAWVSNGDLFANNPDNVASASICDVDATSLAGKPLWLRVANVVGNTGANNAAYRITANGNVVNNTNGKGVISETDVIVTYYDLSSYAGQHFDLSIEAVLRNLKVGSGVSVTSDSVMFGHIQLWSPKLDVAIQKFAFANVPATKAEEDVTLTLRNNSSEDMSNVQVRYRANGGAWTTEVVAGPIKPLSTLEYTFNKKLNLDVDVLYTVEAEVLLNGDENPSNNTASTQVYRNGTDYTMMACGTLTTALTATSTPQYFTDNGGKAGNYGASCRSAITITTTNKNKQVQLRFIEFDTQSGDVLAIHDGGYSSAKQMGVLQGNGYTLPMTYVTTNGSTYGAGQVYVRFDGNAGGAPGFLVEYMEVDDIASDPANMFTLSDILNESGNYVSGQDVRIRIANRSGNPQNDVQVRYRVDNGAWVEETIAQLLTGNYTHTFNQKLFVPESKATFTLEAEVLNSDMLISDNKAIKTLSNDLYCNPLTTIYTTSSGVWFTRVVVEGAEFSQVAPTATGSDQGVNKHRSVVLPVYKDVAINTLDVEIAKKESSYSKFIGGKIGLWIDWNDDFTFGADEGQIIDLNLEENTYSFTINLAGKASGKHTMRLRVLGSTSSYYTVNMSPCDDMSYGIYGETEDFTIEVLDTDPNAFNIGLSTLSGVTSGQNLSAAQTVGVQLVNNGSKVATGFTLELVVDGVSVATETYTGSIAPKANATHTFAATANLSAPGYHTVEVYANMAGDADPSDNYLSTTIYNETPGAQAGEWTLSFDGADDVVNAGTLGNANLQSFTYEAWIRPNSTGGYGASGFGRVFSGKGLMLFSNGHPNHNIYPQNCFVISVGDDGSYFTNLGTFNAGVWQHVAVTHNTASKETKLYLNGVEMDLNINKQFTAMADNSASTLFIGNSEAGDRQFDGQIDNARVWNVVRSQAEIQANMSNGTSMAGTSGLVAEFLFNEGPFTSTTVNGVSGEAATIHNATFGDDEASIWQPYRVLRSFEVNNMLTDWNEVAANSFSVDIDLVADISALVPEFVADFAGAEVTANGNVITSGSSTINFNSPVTITATAQHCGQTFTETYIYEVNAARELQSLSVPALSISYSGKVPQLIEVESDADVTALTTTYTTNMSATVLFNGQTVASGDAVDYSNPVVIEVIGNSGVVNATYTVMVKRTQTISWGAIAQNRTYGDAKFALTATASSGGKVVYESSNPEVISVDAGQATINGAGTATITAHQLGGNGLTAVSEAMVFNVAKATLTITADDKSINYSEALPELTMSFSGFVNGENESSLDQLPTIATTATASSPAGVYPITLTGGSDNNYAYNLVEGQLTIISVTLHEITFNVTYGGAAEADATIEVNGKTLTTDAAGQATISLMPGDYPYTVTKDGREPYSATLTVTAAATVNVEMIAALPFYTLTYAAGQGGNVIGNVSQSVKQGNDGTEVEAVANAHYTFVGWNDGVATAKRTDSNVQGDISVIAQFEAATYTVTYVAGEGGSLSGELTQSIKYGNTGSAVTATPADGFGFMGWSDGRSDNPRTDSPEADLNVTALFGKIYTAPYTQTFDTDALPEDWATVDNYGANKVWTFKKSTKDGTVIKGSDANYAIFDCDSFGSGGQRNGDLISPAFDFSGNSSVSMSFNHYFKGYGYSTKATATVYYNINDGEWIQLKQWTDNTANPENPAPSFDIDAVAGKTNVRFKWNYTYNGWGYYWLIDDIKIEGVKPQSDYTLTYRAGANGSLEGADASGVVTAVVDAGQNGPSVVAVPANGYVFKQWSDGSTDNPRQDVSVKNIDVTAEFGLDCNIIISALPYSQDFAAQPDCWTADGNWTFDGAASLEDAGTLTSARFDLSAYSDAYIVFDAGYYGYGASAKLQYSTDDGVNWTDLKSFASSEAVNIKLPTLSDAMRFRWTMSLTSAYGFGMFGIENLQITDVAYGTITYVSNYYYNPSDGYNYYFGGTEYNGSLKGNQVITEKVGTSITVTATPADDWIKFVTWDDGNTNATRTDVITENAQTITAVFDSIVYTVAYMPGEGGTISGESEQRVRKGKDGTPVTAIANDGYRFVQWNDGETNATRVAQNVQADLIVTAEFESLTPVCTPVTHEFAEVACGSYEWNGQVYTTSDDYQQTFVAANGCDSTVTLHLTINQPVTYDFADEAEESYIWNGTEYTTSGNYTKTFVAANGCDSIVTLHLTIGGAPIPTYYTVNLSVSDAAAGTVTGAGDYAENTEVTVEAVANEGYAFVQWSDGETANSYTFIVTGDVSLTAEFEVLTYNLAYTAGANGSLTGEPTQTVAHGQSGTAVEAVAENGFKFLRWSDGRTDNPRTDTNVKADVAVEAEFVAEDATLFTLTYTAGEGGRIQGAAQQTVVERGNGIAVTAVADKGYRFVQWRDGVTTATRTEESVTADIAVEAEFIRVFRVDYLAAANGSIEGAALQIVDKGSRTTAVTAVPAEGYRFVSWSDGSTEATRTDVVEVDDLTLVARFELIRYILTINVLDADAKPIAFAKVKIGEKEYKANSNGMVVDTLVPDRYTYTVECDGYDAKSGEVVLTSDTLVKVALSKTATGLFDGSTIESLSVYPNPTTNGIFVEGNGDVVRIFSMGGQLMLQQPAFGRTYVDLERLPAGTYIIRLGNAQGKVVKQ